MNFPANLKIGRKLAMVTDNISFHDLYSILHGCSRKIKFIFFEIVLANRALAFFLNEVSLD